MIIIGSAVAGGGGTPGGSDTEIQFNNAGAFGGSADLTWDGTLAQLAIVGRATIIDLSVPGSEGSSYAGLNVEAQLADTDAGNSGAGLAVDFYTSGSQTLDLDTLNGANFNVVGAVPVGRTIDKVNGFNVDARATGAGAIGVRLTGWFLELHSEDTVTVPSQYGIYMYMRGGSPNIGDSYGIGIEDIDNFDVTGTKYGIWLSEHKGGAATYYAWFDARGVVRWRQDDIDGIGNEQAIGAVYNPRFDKYVPNAPDYERGIYGQFVNNTYQIGAEVGDGSDGGILRGVEIIGASLTTPGYHEMVEMAAPAAGAADSVRMFIEDDGAGKTRLMAQFATGAAQQIAIEP